LFWPSPQMIRPCPSALFRVALSSWVHWFKCYCLLKTPSQATQKCLWDIWAFHDVINLTCRSHYCRPRKAKLGYDSSNPKTQWHSKQLNWEKMPKKK
jgi:hypothetical protein